MHVLILGGGGREHALAWKIAESPLVQRLSVAPGNAGIKAIADCVALDITDVSAVTGWAEANAVDLVVIGPEAPLVAGVADGLAKAGIAAFGPSAAAAQLESSKTFTKEICDACGAPTAAWARFTDRDAAHDYLTKTGAPIVIKADGLAAGKGVVVATTLEEAREAVDSMLGGAFGAAGASIVIEECLTGEEASFFVLTDGENALPLASAQDHKRAFDGDAGPNTGGMGAYSPAPIMTPEIEREVMERIIRPTIAEMARRGTPYRGLLYAGLMIGPEGPKLIEYNARFGDPETQALMLRLRSDLVPALMATAKGSLQGITLDWAPDPAITVVMAARGYPGEHGRGDPIDGFDEAGEVEGVTIFHAGTAEGPGGITANGGRVLNVSATAPTLAEARARAYRALDLIDWEGGFYRHDIAWRALPDDAGRDEHAQPDHHGPNRCSRGTEPNRQT